MKSNQEIMPESHSETTADPGLEPLLRRPLRQNPSEADTYLNSVAIGKILQVEETTVLVTIPSLGSETYQARSLCVLPEDCQDRECAILFENGDRTRPLIMGLMLHHPVQERQRINDEERILNVDGERVVITADTELELRCGESIILLQRDGRIEIRGNYITSQATATQRLRGGSIHMN